MHTREISIGKQTISIETGRLAKQADGSVIVRLGDTMVLVTACADANPREGVDFLPLTCDYKENTYASGRIPGGFFKREGKPPEKEVLTSRLIDRPIRPLFPDGLAQRDADHRARHLRRHRQRLRRARDYRRVGGPRAVEHPVDADDRRRARRPRGRRLHHQPDLRAAEAQHARSHRRRQQGRHRDGRGGREGSAGSADGGGARARARGDQADRGGHRRSWPRRPARPSGRPRRRRKSRRTSSRKSRARCSARSATRCGSRTSSRTTRPSTRCWPITSRSSTTKTLELKTEKKLIAKGLKEKVLRDEILERGQRLDGRKFDEIRNDHDRGRRPPAHARLLPVHARRDPGARHRHARHRGRPAEGRDRRRRDVEALHAALQLPAVLGR